MAFMKVTNSIHRERCRLIMEPVKNCSLPLQHRRSEIVDPLGFSTQVQRCNNHKETDLDCKLDVTGLPPFYRPVPRHTPWGHGALHCLAESWHLITAYQDVCPGRLTPSCVKNLIVAR
ncbi:hypothetical protein TNCV_4056961 [Trichonephila clavipes]|nr:hypothetical protein TNCV_4056961 [Trichonephila clavipes]